MATDDSDNPNLRDRGFICWSLVRTDPEAAKTIGKPVIEDDTIAWDSVCLAS